MTLNPSHLRELIPSVSATADGRLQHRLQQRLDRKTKPPGSLGRLESLAVQIGLVLRDESPQLLQPQMLVFAGDHGLAAQGVSAYPQDVTWQMVENMLAGGAAVSVLTRQHGITLTLVDAGIARELAPRPGLLQRKIGFGTQDALQGPAMTMAQCVAAVAAGRAVLRERPGNVVLFGEMGIGNTSSAALLMARLGHLPIAQCTGRGTGLDDAGVARKTAVLEQVLQRHAQASAPMEALAALGGFEIAMLVGALLQAAHERRLMVIDGFIVGAALLVAQQLAPAIGDYCVFAHRGAEAGHAHLLRLLDGQPLLELGLRLGEGSGAALAWPLVDAAARVLREMASFESAGVSDRKGG
ncbi:nicotinate-nucleotide--dimethylbenzimidazole phosphoribosyltransferase [Ideonella sp. BN130291]|uniref:nicotinate-nucleotide--dimethylbenzimidazole phosphoribosyltransferase n=1 Tax=Ideonella sp. BN130291 TaxID=3112940 RepID=UPI002E256182|nr:nicotinate-nucleotide--dimethylbenzimidazole phosphoribosyltransferase [Ideonella sp. BN130291]